MEDEKIPWDIVPPPSTCEILTELHSRWMQEIHFNVVNYYSKILSVVTTEKDHLFPIKKTNLQNKVTTFKMKMS